MVGQAHLLHALVADAQRAQPLGHQHPRLDGRARGDDGGPVAVHQAALAGQPRGHLAEHLRLQLRQVGQGAAHPSGCVVLGEPVAGEHEGEHRAERRVERVGVLLDRLARGVALLGVERVAHR